MANTSVLPAVCIDALTNPVIAPHGGYAIVVVVSHTASPADFDSFITSQVRNQHVVAYCNDGKYGGSKIQSVQDMREVSWWQNCRAAGQLPAGDAILVRDIDTASLAVQIGVNNPPKTHMMVFLGSVTYGKDISSGYSVSKELDAVRTIEDSETRCERIDKLRHSANATPLQVIRMDHLHGLIRKGVEVGTWWDRVGGDCGLDTLDSLRQTEAILAASCKETLSKSVDMNDPSTSKLILEYVEDCKKASQRVGTTPPATLVPAMQMPGVKNTKPRRAPYVPSGVFRLEMRFADKRDCNRIAEIAAFYLGAGNAITARTVKAWIARNRRIFRVGEFFPNPRNHRNEPHVAGYYSMVPMSIGIYRLLKEGKIHDYEIPEKSIREFTSSDVKAIYIMDLMCCSCCDVHPEGSDRVKHALLEDAVWNVDRILDGNRCIEEVSSLLASKEGIALVRGLGFKRTSVNELGWEFWVLDKIGIEARHENRKIDSLLRNNMFKDRYEVL